MKISAVILNYNDGQGTVDALKRISGFSCFDSIVAVDNASTDDSISVIETSVNELNEESGKFHFIKNEKNGGYGYGNNRGVRYAYEKLGAELVVIANPDAEFGEELIREMSSFFRKKEAQESLSQEGADQKNLTAAVGAVMHRGGGSKISYEEFILSGWKRRSMTENVLNGGPLLKRIFKKKLNYSPEHYETEETAAEVFAVHGSLFMVSAEKFIKAGGYDEGIFLYCEENVLAERLKSAGYKTFLLKKTYQHAGSQSITGSGIGAVRRQKFRNASELYYYRNYLKAGKTAIKTAALFQKIVLLETGAAAVFGRI